ncbi:MAG: ATP-binding protein [Burkholderiales bacterium]
MYQRPHAKTLQSRLSEVPRQIQILTGPRQIGKTTLVTRVLDQRPAGSSSYITANEGGYPIEIAGEQFSRSEISPPRSPRADSGWLVSMWQQAVTAARTWHAKFPSQPPYVLVIDEIQKVPNWSESVKGLWDENLRSVNPLHVVLLGSSPLLVQKGLTESLAGRFELIRMLHWTFEEMNEAFGWTLEQYIYFGGYPGSARLISEEDRWRNYVRDVLIAPNIEKDVLELTRVDHPALLKQLFEIGCTYSGQIVALDKVLGVLNSTGNTTTLSRYMELLDRASLLRGLLKFSDHEIRRRRSPPKFQVFNTALMSALGAHGFDEAKADRGYWGRLAESAIGAHLCNETDPNISLHYWREGHLEVDFIVRKGAKLLAIEVKSGSRTAVTPGLQEFRRRNPECRPLIVGGEDCSLGEFLMQPVAHWFS